jgi:putative transposase
MSLQGNLSIERMCQLAQVSRAGFYRSMQEHQPVAEEMELRSTIQQIGLEHRRRYGYRRVTAELRRRGMIVNHKRVSRMMREDNLLAVQPRAFVVTTDSRHELEVYLNLARRMKLTGLNQLWVADITYIRLQTEFVYLAVILDGFSRKVVGWALGRTLATQLPKDALEKAITERQPPPGLVHHSDRGSQYASDEYVQVLQAHQMIPSMSRPANPYDNASCESFMKTLKREEIYANDYVNLEHLRANLGTFIEHYYNRCRWHSALGYRPPDEFEQQLESTATVAGATMSFFRHGKDYRPDAAGAGTGGSSETKTKSGPQTALQTIGIDESPTGYSLASCSPAELASASPAGDDPKRVARV